MDILIKSFNRPFYLDRCIQSIFRNVDGDCRITVLDDGTQEKYLDKLKGKYPSVNIQMSVQAENKRKAIAEHLSKSTPIDGFSIPTDLWKNAVEKAGDYVLVTEDDVWFTKKINLDAIVKEMQHYQIPLVKLGWLGMRNDEAYCKNQKLTDHLDDFTPKGLFTSNKLVMDWFMFNKYKFFTVLYKLGIVDNTTKEKYWSINSILMGLYDKKYWLAIWKDAAGRVDEKQQLRNAAAWYNSNKKALFAKASVEVMKTTFQSSATGSYHEYDNQFDVNRFNYIINEAWFRDEFDAMENYPHDFSEAYIKTFLDKENHPDAQHRDWIAWAERFKNQYKNLGAITY